MVKYSLLIIDDDWNIRQADYERLLGDESFDFNYIKSGKEIETIAEKTPHAFLLDMDLSKWVTSPLDRKDLFYMATDLIDNKAPVFLVSSKWDSEVITWLNGTKKIKVLHFISWNDDVLSVLSSLKSDGIIPTRLNIKKELDNYYQREWELKNADEQVIILDISDLQFGDRHTDDDSAMLEGLLPKFLREKNISIDLLLISGDIASNGYPDEFAKAKQWIEDLCSGIFEGNKNFRSRILLIPGNHDVNLKLNAVDGYDYNFDKRILEPRKEPESQHHLYGLVPFRQFAYELTGNINWITDKNNLFLFDDRFLQWGIRFYLLNTVCEQNFLEPAKRSAPLDYLNVLRNAPALKDPVYKIILSHHGPNHLGYDLDASNKNWKEIRNFIETVEPNLFLYGHVHKSQTFSLPEKGKAATKMKFHMAPTLTLSEQATTDGARRGFSVIELKRKNGTVTKAKIRQFEIDGAKCIELKD